MHRPKAKDYGFFPFEGFGLGATFGLPSPLGLGCFGGGPVCGCEGGCGAGLTSTGFCGFGFISAGDSALGLG